MWVDSLCIDQTSSEDLHTVIPEMTSIYGYAYMTLVVAAGKVPTLESWAWSQVQDDQILIFPLRISTMN